MASLGSYIYSESDTDAVVHLYVAGSGRVHVGGQTVTLRQETRYPWEGVVELAVEPERAAEFGVKLRIPGWCRQASMAVNGEEVPAITERGYVRIHRIWQPGDTISVAMAMPVERVYAHPEVRMNQGRVALIRGPLAYCFEATDNGRDLNALVLPRDAALNTAFVPDLLDGIVTVNATGVRELGAAGGDLYHYTPPAEEPARLTAVPYYAWDNRTPGDMLVWVRDR
jgi:DUF1680 family protein